MKIFLVDDHTILLEGMISLLEKEDELEIAGYASNAEDALEFLQKEPVDLLICDQSLPGMDGLALIKQVKKFDQNLKIIVLSVHVEAHLVKEILRSGVNGYILKKDSHLELLTAIESIVNDEIYLSQGLNRVLLSGLMGAQEQSWLTNREREILKLIAADFSNKQIAAKLHISQRTVETHRKNLLRKTRSNSVVGLVNYAYTHNLL